jgi:hypothetical protein
MSIPGGVNPLLLRSAAAAGGYTISRSLRFNSADSSFLSRTPASAGNRKTWTWAGWVKKCNNGTDYKTFFTAFTNTSNYLGLDFTDSDQLRMTAIGGQTIELTTTAVYRDLSAWMHIVYALDSTQATASNRVKLYVNGSQVTTFSSATYPSQNSDSEISRTVLHQIGRNPYPGFPQGLNAYLADIHFIDGQALDPTSFGEFSATTGVWMPKQYTGTYGSQGWKLSFADNSTAAALGTDSSGAGNTWTVNNLSVTAGAGNDSLVDVPTNGSEVDTGAGGQVRGNYATLNPLTVGKGSNGSLANGNLENAGGGNPARAFPSTIAATSGKFYAEFTITSNNYVQIGAVDSTLFPYSSGAVRGSGAIVWEMSTPGSVYYINSTSSSGSPPSPSGGDVGMVAFDATTRKVWFGRNGTWNNSGNPAAGTNEIGTLNGSDAIAFFERAESTTVTANFGARSFAYTAPSGFKALCTANLPAPVITKPSTVMDVALYTGNGSTQTISGLAFSPDLVWLKSRSNENSQSWFDTLRGTAMLASNQTGNESSFGSPPLGGYINTFNSDGFTFANGSINNTNTNQLNWTYAAWAWDAGSSTVTNTQGSISSQVRANASAGFSVVTYTGTGSNATVGHGLGVKPAFYIVKGRSNSDNWCVYHTSLTANNLIFLNLTNASGASARWNNTEPTSTVFSLGTDSSVNGNGTTYVCYAFAPVAGYSSFGRYTGNGSADGPFVYTGFRPRWIMLKRADSNSSWAILDATRLGYNVRNDSLYANLADAEANFGLIDILSNGFKLRATFGSENGGTHIYAAFAESPFQYARAR